MEKADNYCSVSRKLTIGTVITTTHPIFCGYRGRVYYYEGSVLVEGCLLNSYSKKTSLFLRQHETLIPIFYFKQQIMTKIITTLLFMTVLLLQQGQAQPFIQIGNDIDAEAAYDGMGAETKLSGDGQRLIVGAPGNEGGSISFSNAGHARVYEWNGTAWIQLGNDIDGINTSLFGFEVNISEDGNRVVVGDYASDIVRVFEWDGTDWVQLGVDITSGAPNRNHQFGLSLEIAENGNKIIVGAPLGDIGGYQSGYAKVYEWNGTTWTQVGNTVMGNVGEKLGFSVSITEDANYIIVGSPSGRVGTTTVGHVQVHNYDGSNWVQVGNNIDGNTTDNESFGYTVDIADHGHVVVVGDNRYGSNERGSVQAFCWNGTSWNPRGGVKTGIFYLDALGSAVEISADGNIMIAAGGEAFNELGETQAFTWNGTTWDARPVIYGEAAGDRAGRSVGLSIYDGQMKIAVGGNYNQGNGVQAGHVRVFEACAPVYIIDSVNTCDTAYTWAIGNGQTYNYNTEICSAPFYVQGTNISGCDTVRILILKIDPAHVPNTIVSQAGNTLSIPAAVGATYQWVDCNNNNAPIAGATSASFTPGQSGQYAVMIDENGCTATSPCYSFTMNSVATLANGQNSLKVYPNPTHQHFTISFENSQEQVQIRLMDVSGRVLKEQSYDQFLQEEWRLEAAAPAGMYILSVQIGTQAPIHQKLIKR